MGIAQGSQGLSEGACRNGIVFESGPLGKALASLDGLPAGAADDVAFRIGVTIQGGIVRTACNPDFLSVADALS